MNEWMKQRDLLIEETLAFSQRVAADTKVAAPEAGIRSAEKRASGSVRTYCGFNPRVSNCRLHSAGASRSRSTPMPRGKRPSTAALTRAGARNASEMVILT